MAQTKEKKSFKKFAKKHLAGVIETRRKTAKAKKEKAERLERRAARTAKEAANEEKEHVEQLERLKETDPTFFSYLEEEDPTLLQFGKDDVELVAEDEGSDAETEPDTNEDEEEDNDEGEGDGREDTSEGANATRRIARAEVAALTARCAATTTATTTSAGAAPSLRDDTAVVERCIDLFVCAARELTYAVREPRKPSTVRKFEETAMVKDTLLAMAQCVGQQIPRLVSGTGAFKSHKTRYLVKRALNALTTALIAGEAADAVLTAGLLHALSPFVPLLHYVKGVTKRVLRAALSLCCAGAESTRLAAYMVVRAIATRATGTRSMYQSAAFKGIFLALVRTAQHYTPHNQATVAFLINCVVDLYGTDMEAAYQHTFVYLRQLALYLRAALLQQSASNVRAVVNWQYLLALRTWGAVIGNYAAPAQLGPLIHPLVQVCMTLMDLFASPQMFPLHLQVIEILNHVARTAEGVYIPVSPYLLRVLTSPSVALTRHTRRAAEAGATAPGPVELPFTIRVKKSQARHAVYHQAVWTETLFLLSEHLATHSATIGFPEAFWAVEHTLKKLRGEVKMPQIHAQVSTLLRHMQTTGQKIIAAREAVNFGPCDLTSVRQFEENLRKTPGVLVTYYQGLRQQRIERFRARQREAQEQEQGRTTLESAIAKGREANRGQRARPQRAARGIDADMEAR